VDVQTFPLAGPLLLTPTRHRDERGFLSETWNERTLAGIGVTDRFIQENHTVSHRPWTVRGLHFQLPPKPMAKLVRVVRGSLLDVAVDVRSGSPTFGQHVSVELSAENWAQLYIPEGFAHGLCTLEPETEVVYLASHTWDPDLDRGVAWDDPDLAIPWPIGPDQAVLSPKDRAQPRLADLPPAFA
jgi:dTDP-4-dehydrorhamnose 3,5-epimerase